MNSYFDLYFKTSSEARPHSPTAQIRLKGTHQNDGIVFIGGDCSSFEELDARIKGLEKELESIRRKAKGKFSK